MRHVLRLLVVLLVVCVSVCAVSGGADDDLDVRSRRAPLRGLKGVNVRIIFLRPAAEEAGLSRTLLQTDVELRLRKNGIRVLDETEAALTLGRPCLRVLVDVTGQTSGRWPTSIDMEMLETVSLVRNPAIVTRATTWGTTNVGASTSRTLPGNVRDSVGKMADEFCNDYLAANPKSVGAD